MQLLVRRKLIEQIAPGGVRLPVAVGLGAHAVVDAVRGLREWSGDLITRLRHIDRAFTGGRREFVAPWAEGT